VGSGVEPSPRVHRLESGGGVRGSKFTDLGYPSPDIPYRVLNLSGGAPLRRGSHLIEPTSWYRRRSLCSAKREMENEIISGRQTLVVIAGFRTGVSVEDAFWNRLKEIAADRNMTLSDLVTTINSEREHNNLSSAIRLFVLDHYRRQAVSSAEEAPERFLTNKVEEFKLDAEQRKRVVVQEHD
jgi:predicted DNA-binding ribbon-helix-helix protein